MEKNYEKSKIKVKNPLVSILILSKNHTEFYNDCIDSIVKQEYNNIEIIICDDSSFDFKKEEILIYIKKTRSSNIKAIKIEQNDKSIGLGNSLLRAIEMSNGEYYIPLTPDKVLQDNEVVEDIVNYFAKSKSTIFTGYSDFYDEKMSDYKERLPSGKQIELLKKANVNQLFKALCKEDMFKDLCMPFAKSLIGEIKELKGDYFTDIHYAKNLKILRNDIPITIYLRPLVKDRIRESSDDIDEILKKDINTAIKNEILPFISKTGIIIYLTKKIELSSKYKI